MTAGMAVEMADGMRPNNDFDDQLKQNWLRECDARLRKTVVERSQCGDFDAMGADVSWRDGLEYDTELMVPEAFAGSIYPHWLCAQMDLALGETARAANEMQLYADAVQEFAMPWIDDPVSTHGTGCTLAAALAAELARGSDVAKAVEGAKRHVHQAIAGSYYVGKDCGVLGFAPRP